MDDEFSALHRQAHPGFPRQDLGAVLHHTQRIETAVPAAVILGAVHGRVGVADQIFGVVAVARKHADAYARPGVKLLAVEIDRDGNNLQQLVGDLGSILGRGEIRENHEELIAAEPRHHVGFAQHLLDARRHLLEHDVAAVMAQRIVDGLEIVQVDEHDRHQGTVAARQRQYRTQALGQVGAIGQAGEHVVVREVLDARLGMFARGDVAHRAHAVRLALDDYGLAYQFHRDPVAVPVYHLGLVRFFAPLAHVGAHRLMPFARHELPQLVPYDFIALVAGDRKQRLVDIGEDAVLVKENAFAGRGRELAHALLAVANLLLGEPVARDIGDQNERAHHLSLFVQMRNQVNLDDAPFAIGQGQRAHVLDVFAPQHALDLRLDYLPRFLADRLAHGLADDGIHVPAVGFGVGLVGEYAAQVLRLVICDQRRHVVGD